MAEDRERTLEVTKQIKMVKEKIGAGGGVREEKMAENRERWHLPCFWNNLKLELR